MADGRINTYPVLIIERILYVNQRHCQLEGSEALIPIYLFLSGTCSLSQTHESTKTRLAALAHNYKCSASVRAVAYSILHERTP
jgi:hypothetical protein